MSRYYAYKYNYTGRTSAYCTAYNMCVNKCTVCMCNSYLLDLVDSCMLQYVHSPVEDRLATQTGGGWGYQTRSKYGRPHGHTEDKNSLDDYKMPYLLLSVLNNGQRCGFLKTRNLSRYIGCDFNTQAYAKN